MNLLRIILRREMLFRLVLEGNLNATEDYRAAFVIILTRHRHKS